MSIPLHVQRRRAVVRELLARGARRILDLGCGEGRLVADLLREPTIAPVTGVDVSTTALRRAAERLHLDELSHRQGDRVSLLQSAVVDATNVQRADRARVVQLAKDADCHAVAVVLDVDVDTCLQRNSGRHDRRVPRHAVARHVAQLRRSRRHLRREASGTCSPSTGPRRSPRRGSSAPGCGWIAAISPDRSTSSATSTAAARSWSTCSRGWGTASTRTSWPWTRPRAAWRSSWVTWSTVARTRRVSCDSSAGWSRPAPRCASRATTRTSSCAACRAARSS